MAEETTTSPQAAPEWLFWLTLALIFVAPEQISHVLHPNHPLFISVPDVLATLAVLVWLGWVTLNGQWRKLSWAPRHVWAFLAVAIISGMAAQSLGGAAKQIFQFVLYFAGVYMLFTNVLTDEHRRRLAVRTLLLATSLVVLYGLAQYLIAHDPAAVTSAFESRGAYSGFLAIALPLFFGLLLWSEVTWERCWAGAVVVIGALTIMLPPLIWVLAISLAVVSITWARRQRMVAALGFIAVFMLVTLAFAPLNQRVPAAGEKPPPLVKKRWIEWMPALTMMANNFALGVGTGNYQKNVDQNFGYLPNVHKSEKDTNSLFLVIGSSMGFAGLVCLLALMGHFWRVSGSLWEFGGTSWGRALTCGLWAMTVAIPLANLFTSTCVRGTALVWVLAYALINSLERSAAENEPLVAETE